MNVASTGTGKGKVQSKAEKTKTKKALASLADDIDEKWSRDAKSGATN